jgi:hypothetical protein
MILFGVFDLNSSSSQGSAAKFLLNLFNALKQVSEADRLM